MTPGQGHSLHLKDSNGTTFEFNGYSKRDDCFELISKQCKALGAPTIFS